MHQKTPTNCKWSQTWSPALKEPFHGQQNHKHTVAIIFFVLCITKVIRSVTVVFLSACESFIQLYRSEPSLQSLQDYREKSLYITESVDSTVFEVQLNSNNVLTTPPPPKKKAQAKTSF